MRVRIKISSLIVGLLSMAGLFLGYTTTTEAEETTFLGIDPSTVLESEEDVRDFNNVQPYSEGNAGVQIENSKKGIQGFEWIEDVDASTAGVKHVLLNLLMDDVMRDENTLYGYEQQIRVLNQNGISVTMVLLFQYDEGVSGWSDLVYNAETGHQYYALKVDTDQAAQTWSTLFEKIVTRFSQQDCHVDNWILGNEVNNPIQWNWTGTLDLHTNARIYADSFMLLYNAIQTKAVDTGANPQAKAYISLDNRWSNTGNVLGGRNFIAAFANCVSGEVNWGVAYHPYAAVLNPTAPGYTQAQLTLWGNNPLTPGSQDARIVSGANLQVLTDFIRDNYGTQHRVILSEQGFDARGGEDYQAAALAYTYYAGQMNDMVDAMMFRAWEDHAGEFGLKLGIKGRKAYNVFKYMDTDLYAGETAGCLRTIGVSSWHDIFGDGFHMGCMSFTDVTSNDWYIDAVRTMNNNGIMTGMNAGYFGAGDNLDRSQFATVLYRAMGSPEQGFIERFPDVADGIFYSIPISWGVETDVIHGYENGYFGPGDPITREQLMTLMYRYAQFQEMDVSARADLSGYSDQGTVSSFARESMEWSVAQGIIRGEGNTGDLNPQGTVSRAVAATILNRYLYEE